MNDSEIVLNPELLFAYSQFYVYDRPTRSTIPQWTDGHVKQGFTRGPRGIAVGTLMEWGEATVRVHFAAPVSLDGFERVIAVPIEIASGELRVDGPEEYEFDRGCALARGHYRLVIAQRLLDCDEENDWGQEDIHLFLERRDAPLEHSEILIADPAFDPPDPLIETGDHVDS